LLLGCHDFRFTFQTSKNRNGLKGTINKRYNLFPPSNITNPIKCLGPFKKKLCHNIMDLVRGKAVTRIQLKKTAAWRNDGIMNGPARSFKRQMDQGVFDPAGSGRSGANGWQAL